MATLAKSNRLVKAAYVCSKCKDKRILTLDLYVEGAANVFLHEKDKAEEAREMAFEQAMKDMVSCYTMPRMLGSHTLIETGTNRITSYYRFLGMDSPCKCGHVEPWQQMKKSWWKPADVPFEERAAYPDVPRESRPFLIDSNEALDAWMADPANPQYERSEKITQIEDPNAWVCSNCKTKNNSNVSYCQNCSVSKQWSDAKAEKKK